MTSILHSSTKNPLFLLASSYVLSCLAIVYVPPKRLLRVGALGIITAHAFHSFQYADASQIPSSTVYICSSIYAGVLLYGSYFLCLAPASPPSTATTFFQKAIWVARLAANPRGIGTSWGLKHLPPFSRQNPAYIPSRTSFLISRTTTCIFLVALLAAFSHIDRTYYWPSLRDGEYAPERESFFRRLTEVDSQEILVRLYLPLQFNLPTYCTLASAHAALAVVAVLCGDEPASWPPLFGSLADAYCLRRFWSHFWQRFQRVAFVAHASFFTHEILQVRKGSPLSRGLQTLLVFVISAGMHAICEKFQLRNCNTGHVIYWFCLMGVGIMVEDWVRSIWRLWEWKESDPVKIWHHILGFMWVWVYFAWSLPKMLYPGFECQLVG